MFGLIGFGLLSLIMLCCIGCGYKSLKIAIDTIDASSEFVSVTKRIILVPILYFILSFVVFMVWMFAFAQVYSIGDVSVDTNSKYPQMKKITWPQG